MYLFPLKYNRMRLNMKETVEIFLKSIEALNLSRELELVFVIKLSSRFYSYGIVL